jgi:carbon storage regulator
MLVLSRKKDESIVINNDITIVVVEIRGDKVRLGVEAPKEVPVHRREVFDAIARGQLIDIPRPELRTGAEQIVVERIAGESIAIKSIVPEARSAAPVELLPPAADAVS